MVTRFTPLSKAKKIIVIFSLVAGTLSAIQSSWLLSKGVCEHFMFLGAGKKAFTVFYAIFTLYAVLYNVFNGDKFYRTSKEKQSKITPSHIITLSSVFPVYLINLSLAFYFVGIPVITQGLTAGLNHIRLALTIVSVFIMPLLPMALSIPIVILLPKKRNRRFRLFVNVFVLPLLSILTMTLFNGVHEFLSSKAYVLSTYFSKYYFPAAFFENFLTNGNDILIFIVTNLAAFYLSFLMLNKFNRKQQGE